MLQLCLQNVISGKSNTKFYKSLNKREKNLTFPRASRPLSKKRITPRIEKKKPKPRRPNPISAYQNQIFKVKSQISVQFIANLS